MSGSQNTCVCQNCNINIVGIKLVIYIELCWILFGEKITWNGLKIYIYENNIIFRGREDINVDFIFSDLYTDQIGSEGIRVLIEHFGRSIGSNLSDNSISSWSAIRVN